MEHFKELADNSKPKPNPNPFKRCIEDFTELAKNKKAKGEDCSFIEHHIHMMEHFEELAEHPLNPYEDDPTRYIKFKREHAENRYIEIAFKHGVSCYHPEVINQELYDKHKRVNDTLMREWKDIRDGKIPMKCPKPEKEQECCSHCIIRWNDENDEWSQDEYEYGEDEEEECA